MVIVVGCGRVGAELAWRLARRGARVSVIDRNADAFANLPADFEGLTIEGSALAEDVLRRARIDKADALAAVTSNDALNAVVAHIAKTVYRVPRVAARNFDPRNLQIFEAFGLEVVSSSVWGAQRLEEMLISESAMSVLTLGGGEVSVFSIPIPAHWVGKIVREIMGDSGIAFVALKRSGQTMVASLDLRLEAGDIVYLSASPERLRALLGNSRGG